MGSAWWWHGRCSSPSAPIPGPPVTLAMAWALCWQVLFIRRTRPLTLFVLAPFLLLYGIYFSYAIRNALLAFPLIALVCGEMVHRARRDLSRKPGFAREPYAGVNSGRCRNGAVHGDGCSPASRGAAVFPDAVVRALTNSWIIDTSRLFGIPALVTALLALVCCWSASIRGGSRLAACSRLDSYFLSSAARQ